MISPKKLAAEIDALHRDLTFELQKRDRPDRHPYQVGILFAVLLMASAQILLGVPPSTALYDTVTRATLLVLDITFIVGAGLTLWGAALSRAKHFALSVRLGMYGHLSTFVSSLTYASLVIVATDDPGSRLYWMSVAGVMFPLGLAYASVHRFIQMRGLLKEYCRRRQASE